MTTEKDVELLKDAVFAIAGIISSSDGHPKAGSEDKYIRNHEVLAAILRKFRAAEVELKGRTDEETR